MEHSPDLATAGPAGPAVVVAAGELLARLDEELWAAKVPRRCSL